MNMAQLKKNHVLNKSNNYIRFLVITIFSCVALLMLSDLMASSAHVILINHQKLFFIYSLSFILIVTLFYAGSHKFRSKSKYLKIFYDNKNTTKPKPVNNN